MNMSDEPPMAAGAKSHETDICVHQVTDADMGEPWQA